MSYYYGRKRRRNTRRLPKRRSKRRYSRYTRTTRRPNTFRRKVNAAKRMESRTDLKRRRLSIGLPPLRLKHITQHEYPTANQWVDSSGGAGEDALWNYSNYLDNPTSYGEGVQYLVSPNIKFYPQYLTLRIIQPATNITRYRVMLIKNFSHQDLSGTPFTPADVLEDSSSVAEKLYSTYTSQRDQEDILSFKVIYDRLFTLNSNVPNINTKKITIKMPARNIEVVTGQTSITKAKNGLTLVIVTDATPATAGWTMGYKSTWRWVDYYDHQNV